MLPWLLTAATGGAVCGALAPLLLPARAVQSATAQSSAAAR
jgi:hypothetical protein